MARAEILERTTFEILLYHRRADVRGAAHRRRVTQLLADRAHDRREHALLLGYRLGRTALGKRDGGEQRATPGAEILRGEVVAEIRPDVVVQTAGSEVAHVAVHPVPEDARTAVDAE